jgi:hypothetical protein
VRVGLLGQGTCGVHTLCLTRINRILEVKLLVHVTTIEMSIHPHQVTSCLLVCVALFFHSFSSTESDAEVQSCFLIMSILVYRWMDDVGRLWPSRL